jgi:AcrR family transcriptional regulator
MIYLINSNPMGRGRYVKRGSKEGVEAVPGRPRDPVRSKSILDAALELGGELGFDALTVEGIAERAGVGKATIYRRWPNAFAIVMDAFLAEIMRASPIQHRSTARESFTASMRSLVRLYSGRHGKMMRALVGRAQGDQKLMHILATRWVEPRRQIARAIIRSGIESGELRPGLDADVVLDALYGPIYHRMLVPYPDSKISDRFVHAVVDTVFGGLETKSAVH